MKIYWIITSPLLKFILRKCEWSLSDISSIVCQNNCAFCQALLSFVLVNIILKQILELFFLSKIYIQKYPLVLPAVDGYNKAFN